MRASEWRLGGGRGRSARLVRSVLAAAAVAAVIACGPEPAPSANDASTALHPPLDREAVLGPFLSAHWQLPVPLQGPPPPEFSEAEASLDPATCGACHPQQHAQWRTSLHAGAFSPGFAGQLVEGPLSQAQELRACQTCHAPLEEQQPVDAAGRPQPAHDPALRAQGIVCAACHVRAHRRYGPPRRVGVAPPPGPPPHGGFEARPEFLESRFCAACHQFFGDPGVNGKPLENTWLEWRASPHAAAGQTCQSCHMPDRAHLWRGIHDAGFVRAAVDVALERLPDGAEGALRAALVVRARGVGHRFPTYVTPRVFVAVWQEDAAGRELPDTRVEAAIGREIDFATTPWSEGFDTRVAPGESVKLDYALPRAAGAVALRGRVTVDPDHHYRGVFESLLPALEDPEARRLIAEALARTRASRYVLADRVVDLRGP